MQEARAVYILKSKSDTTAQDPYEQECVARKYPCCFVPVLTFQFCNKDRLSEVLSHLGGESTSTQSNYVGIIITSQRAAQAVKSCLCEKKLKGGVIGAGLVFYVVGETTAKLVKEAFEISSDNVDKVVVAASASLLAPLILEKEKEKESEKEGNEKRRLMYLCGNMRRDELPNALSAAGIPFDELCIYQTNKMGPGILFPWEQQQDETTSVGESAREDVNRDSLRFDWVCFFSPSGVKVIAKAAKKRNEERNAKEEKKGEEEGEKWSFLPSSTMKLAAIGKTTAAAMQRRGIPADVIAVSPTAPSLLGAIEDFEKRYKNK